MLAQVKNNKGQGLVEYILILVVTVAIILSLLNNFFTPVQTFLGNYMGSYVACLLETGELPSLGGDSTVAEDQGCNARFEPASLADGRPPREGGATSPPGNKSGGSSSNPEGGGGSSGGGGTYAGSSSRMGGRSVRSPGVPPGGADGGSGASGPQVEVVAASDTGGGGSFFKAPSNSSYRGPGRRTGAVAIAGLSDGERKKIEAQKPKGGARLISSEGVATEPKKIPVKKPPQKTELKDDSDDGFTIGNFLRIILIAAIIIAIVIFIGGQALQLSKNFEK